MLKAMAHCRVLETIVTRVGGLMSRGLRVASIFLYSLYFFDFRDFPGLRLFYSEKYETQTLLDATAAQNTNNIISVALRLGLIRGKEEILQMHFLLARFHR